MESLQKMMEQGRLCRSLRTKTMFYQVEENAGSLAPEHHGPFWCARTQGLYGPDGKIAEPEGCTPGRGCCQTA
jgi:hypothetical protein